MGAHKIGMSVECKCPMCKKLHKMKVNWIGVGRPWKYCNQCSGKVSALSGGLDNSQHSKSYTSVHFSE